MLAPLQSWTFPAGDAWLNLETGWRLDLRPGSLPDAPSSNTARRSLEDGHVNYRITTITGKEAGAGTGANVYIDVFGIRFVPGSNVHNESVCLPSGALLLRSLLSMAYCQWLVTPSLVCPVQCTSTLPGLVYLDSCKACR